MLACLIRQDSVFVQAGPGDRLVYPYHLPADHAPGLHWYHAHFHGSSAFQLMSGLVGALVVDPAADGSDSLPASLSPASSSYSSHVLVITKLMLEQEVSEGEVTQGCAEDWACDADEQAPLCTGSESFSPFNPFRIYSLQELAEATGSNMDMDIQLEDSSDQDLNLVNGLHAPLQNLTTNAASVLRIVHAAGGGPLYLTVQPDSQGVPPCSLTVLAWDGVYLQERLPQDTVSLVAASRVDVEVNCSVSGLHALVAGPSGNTLLYLYSTDDSAFAATHPAVTSAELAAITRPWYLADLLQLDAATEVHSRYDVSINQANKNTSSCLYWLGAGNNCSGEYLAAGGDTRQGAGGLSCMIHMLVTTTLSDRYRALSGHAYITCF